MTHEFKEIVKEGIIANQNGLKSVLVSVVSLEGSSYRKPGVRMLITEKGKMTGAVSGGCVEKEIVYQAQKVFQTGESLLMTYNGKYRLGCEGVLYILIEIFNPSNELLNAFSSCLTNRNSFELFSYFDKEENTNKQHGTFIKIENQLFPIDSSNSENEIYPQKKFYQKMFPCFKLILIGAEHDAVILSEYAKITGWEITIVAGIKEQKSKKDFPTADYFFATTPESFEIPKIDEQTAIILMNHNFTYDLRYLVALKDTNPCYIGVLGPSKRRNDLLSQFIELCPEITTTFLDKIHGPAGLNIGAITPEEIAISIISEILAFTRNRNPISLSEKTGSIHSN